MTLDRTTLSQGWPSRAYLHFRISIRSRIILKTFVACSIGRYAKQFASQRITIPSTPNSNRDDDASGREYETEDISFFFRQTTKRL